MSFTNTKPWLYLLLLLLFILSFRTQKSKGLDTLAVGQSLSGNQTLTSQGGTFELGFFTPGNSKNYYIGIWYKGLPNKTVVWVANRNEPLSDSSLPELKLFQDGNLVLLNQFKTPIWSTNSISNIAHSTSAMLLDNGNFVIRGLSNSSNVILWQSLDYPTDSWLPGWKVGFNKIRNSKYSLTSWRSPENPAPSLFSFELDPSGTTFMLFWNESKMYWTSGEWTGKIFKLIPEMELDIYIKNVTQVSNENEIYFTYEASFNTTLPRYVIEPTGQFRPYWGNNFTRLGLYWTRPLEKCQVHAFCGGFSTCSQDRSTVCDCMHGFEPRVMKNWELEDHTDGCVRRTRLNCSNGENDGFFMIQKARLPVNSESVAVGSIENCKVACLSDCFCTAYAYDNECLIWKGDLYNLQELSSDDKTGKEFYVRLAESELEPVVNTAKKSDKKAWLIVGAIVGFFIFFGIVMLLIWIQRRKTGTFEGDEGSLVVFQYRDIRRATKNFSEKLGEGGFGTVFRGTLPNSTAIAVKRLKNQEQGEKQDKQFLTEVSTIGMIQHINLIRLRGFCIKGMERFLVFDYMLNGSLESHLFRKDLNVLDWKTRYKIALGTARGLAYLHEKCRDCIIHCDIKPENILLDADYNSKVADFGLAKLIGREFSHVLTTIRGTVGYLAPEWISGEAITPKADVFSYGMLLFEIISGRRNRELFHDGPDIYFPVRVFNIINQGEDILSLLDQKLESNADAEELNRACRVACWCIQFDERDRPTMGQVVKVLEGVLEVGLCPTPRFLQALGENSIHYIICQETSSGSKHMHEDDIISTFQC
ncbi:unnamed protein product [Ilex paraguariensis]|uniref:Receptor-like serine/threonine-protein kinase n=1 Tax=Ilex paraguariensis TaxID=185542 RepID=A0ABC8RX86_9AQUA